MLVGKAGQVDPVALFPRWIGLCLAEPELMRHIMQLTLGKFSRSRDMLVGSAGSVERWMESFSVSGCVGE